MAFLPAEDRAELEQTLKETFKEFSPKSNQA
jgi:hypothetical protein